MAGKLPLFRYASSLILASKFRKSPASAVAQSNKIFPIEVQQPTAENGSTSNLSFLMVKRDLASSFMPSTVVFPGGVIDESDYNIKYANAYERIFPTLQETSSDTGSLFLDALKIGDFRRYSEVVQSSNVPQLPLYDAIRKNRSGISSAYNMPPEWAIRVGALRELFEEAGVLIGYSLLEKRHVIYDTTTKIDSIPDWTAAREKVRDSSENFLNLTVDYLNVVPAFWLLEEWSNWLTPSTYKKGRRYETVFYVLCIEEPVAVETAKKELESGEWFRANSTLADGFVGKISLMPPQIYELSRLAKFDSVQDLKHFAHTRAAQGLTRFFPDLCSTADGAHVVIMPGDYLYPENMDQGLSDAPVKKIPETSLESKLKDGRLHRVDGLYDGGRQSDAHIFMTVTPECGHVKPICVPRGCRSVRKQYLNI